MTLPLLAALLLAPGAHQEPDGSRTLGIVPPYHAEPAPPAWLRSASLNRARVDCRHYVYEVYAGAQGRWLVRYILFPETGPDAHERETCLLYGTDPKAEPEGLVASEIVFKGREAEWRGVAYVLVEKRDLLRPTK